MSPSQAFFSPNYADTHDRWDTQIEQGAGETNRLRRWFSTIANGGGFRIEVGLSNYP